MTTSVLAASQRTVLVPPNYISGLTLATPGSNTQFTVAPGLASDSTNVDYLYQTPTLTKNTSSWASGNNAGSLDTGAVANNTWYHVHSIKCPANGAVDVLTSLSPTAPTLPSGFTLFRRVGSMLTTTAATPLWVQFLQTLNDFYWAAPVQNYNAVNNPGISGVLRAFTVPSGVRVKAYLSFETQETFTSSASGSDLYVSDPLLPDNAVTTGLYTMIAYASISPENQLAGGQVVCWTNTSQQVRTRFATSDSGTYFYGGTLGWFDPRGQT